jgi:hypothetical protein
MAPTSLGGLGMGLRSGPCSVWGDESGPDCIVKSVNNVIDELNQSAFNARSSCKISSLFFASVRNCRRDTTFSTQTSPIQEHTLITNHSPVARHNTTGDYDGPNLGGDSGDGIQDRGRARY